MELKNKTNILQVCPANLALRSFILVCVYFCHIEKCPPSKSDESWPSLLWLVDCTAVWRFYCRFYVKFCVNSRPTLLPLCGGRLYADFSSYIKLSHPSGVLCVGVTQALLSYGTGLFKFTLVDLPFVVLFFLLYWRNRNFVWNLQSSRNCWTISNVYSFFPHTKRTWKLQLFGSAHYFVSLLSWELNL